MDARIAVEPAYLKLTIESPINQAFDGTGLDHTEDITFSSCGPHGGFYFARQGARAAEPRDSQSPAMFKPGRKANALPASGQ